VRLRNKRYEGRAQVFGKVFERSFDRVDDKVMTVMTPCLALGYRKSYAVFVPVQLSTLARAFSAAALLIFLAQLQALAADWFPRVWQVDDGLPDNNICGVSQSPDGFLWVATDGGLMRFDGVQFEEFSRPLEGVANRVVRAMLLDRRGRIWLAMDRGAVICAETSSARVFTARDGLPDLRAAVLAEDGEGAIWVGYTGGSGVCRIKEGKVTRLGAREGLPGTGSTWLAADTQGKLWFARGRSVGVFRDGRFQTLQTAESFMTRITPARSGGVWILSGEQISKFEEGREIRKLARLPETGVFPSALLEDREGNVWLGTMAHGLFRYDVTAVEAVGTSHPEITCLSEDREGNIWVGTRGGGLNQIRARTLELISTGLGQPYEAVRSLCEDTSGTLWLVTQNGAVVREEGNDWPALTTENGWPGGHGVCAAAGRAGGIWIGTRDRGLYFCQTNHFTKWSTSDGLASESIRSLLVSSNGDLWIGSDSPRRLQRYREGDFITFKLPGEARSIRAMAEDAAGNIWAATADGRLLEVTGESLIDQTTNFLERPLSIRCLHATADGTLWIGYANWGLGRLKDGRFYRITSQQGLNDDYISQMVSDGRGWLWCAGNHGVFRANIEALVAVAEGRAAHVRSLVYGRPEGLPSLQASYENCPGALQGRDGRLRFPMRTGLLVVYPESIRDNPDPPPVLFESVTVDGQLVALCDARSPLRDVRQVAELRDGAGKIELPPNHRKVEFQFTALSLTAPENVHFRYRLAEVDEGWVEAGAARQASYPHLPAGAYHFRVSACNNTGVWNESGATLAFAVLPYFWQTWWFRTCSVAIFAMAIAGTALLIASRRYRVKLRRIEEQAALDRERARIAKDLHDDLGGSLTQVSMLLELALRDRATPDKLSGHVKEGLGAARQMIKSLDETVWAINPRNDSLPHLINYIGKFAQRFLATAELRCRLDLPDNPPEISMSAEVRHNLFLVLKEALNNIVRHARASEVLLRITTSGTGFELSVQDNGCGVSAGNGGPDDPGADGLRNMEQRMKEIGGSFQLKTSGEGTQVTFVYPWPKHHAAAMNGTVKSG
jgi:signal transduction histidine kinase/ligand-binding sensor domain-containing protein